MADDRPETFAFRMIRREAQLTKNATKGVQRALRAVLTTVVTTTRVDTGNARANWIVTKNKPSSMVITSFPKGSKGSTGPAVSAATIARGNLVIDALTPKNPGAWFSNNVPYIRVINYKYGDLMVERAIQVASATLKNNRFFD